MKIDTLTHGTNYFPNLKVYVYSYALTPVNNTVLPTHKIGMQYWLLDNPPVVMTGFDSIDEVINYINTKVLN